jgi:LysR family transcriptional regulator for metE and metH
MSFRIETRHLLLMDVVTEEGTLTRAGRRLYLTQSAVSRQLLDLEAGLGTQLFMRAGKRMVPTQAGLHLLATARPVLAELERAQEELKRIGSGQHGSVRLSTECYTCYHWLPNVLSRFHERFPHIDVELVVEVTRDPLPALLRGELDLAIMSEDPQDTRLSAFPLFEDEMVAVMHPDNPLVEREFLEAQDFADQHFIMYAMTIDESTVFQEILIPAGVKPKRLSSVQLTEAMLALVKANVGIAALASWAVAPDVVAGTLVAVPLTRGGLKRHWHGVTIRQEEVPVHLKSFMKLLTPGPQTLIPQLAARSRRRA